MQSAFYEIIAVTLLVASPAVSSPPPPDLSPKCVQALAAVAGSALGLTFSGDRIHIGSTEVRLQAQLENEVKADTKFLIGMRVDVYVNGVLQPLTAGAVGIGNDRDDAVQTAVSEWAIFVGEALLGALGVKISEEPHNLGPFAVYQGLAGIGGSPTANWPAEKDAQLLHHLETFIRELEPSPGDLHSISLLVSVEADGTTLGECRVDGTVSSALLETLQSFPWGRNVTYVFKQFYVLRRR